MIETGPTAKRTMPFGYKQHLTAKNDDLDHVKQTCSAISKVLDGCGFNVFDDVQVSAVENWIVKQRKRPNFGIRTANYHTKAVKAFLTWMVKNSRAPSNPLAHLADLNGKVDVRRQRRSLSHEDFRRLVEAAYKGKVFRRLSGSEIGTTADDIRSQTPPLTVIADQWAKSGQEMQNPLPDKGFDNDCHCLSERRARDSNPQPLTRHLISSRKGTGLH